MMSHIRKFRTGTFYSRLFLLMTLLVGSTAAAFAAHTVTVKDFKIKADQQKEVAISLNTTETNVVEVEGTITLPKELEFVTTNGKAYQTTGTITSGASTALKPSNGRFDVRYIPKKAFSGKNGSVLIFAVKASESLSETSTLSLTNLVVTTMDGKKANVQNATATVTLDSDTPDDPTPITPEDPTEAEFTLSFTAAAVEMIAGEEATVEVALANGAELKAFEATLEPSEGLTVVGVTPSYRMADGTFNFNNNKVKYLNLGGAIAGSEGTIFSVKLKAADDLAGQATLTISNVHASATGADISIAPAELTINVISKEEIAKQVANDAAYEKLSKELAEQQAALDAAKNEINNNYPYVAGQFTGQENAIQNKINDTQKALDEKYKAVALNANSNIDAEKKEIADAIAKLKSDAAAAQAAYEQEQAEQAANEAAFNAYKAEKKAEVEALAQEGDSEAAQKIISDALNAIDNVQYKSWDSLDRNKANIDAIVNPIADALAAQRAADEAAAKQAANDAAYEKLMGELDGLQADLDKAKEQIEENNADVADQFTEAEEAIQKQIDDLKAELKEKSDAVELNDESNIDEQKAEIAAAIEKLKADADAAQEAYEKALAEAEAKKAANEAAYEAINKQIGILLAKIDLAKMSIRETCPDVAANYDEQLDALKAQVEKMQGIVDEMHDKIELSESTLDDEKNAQIALIETSILAITAEAGVAQAAIDANRDAYTRLSIKLDAVQAALDAVKETLKGECADVAANYDGQVADLQKQIDAAKAALKAKYDAGELNTDSSVNDAAMLQAIADMLAAAREAQKVIVGIQSVKTLEDAIGYYDLNGKPVNGLQKGKTTIVRMRNGQVRKIVTK